jgi:hypothetical protein
MGRTDYFLPSEINNIFPFLEAIIGSQIIAMKNFPKVGTLRAI